MGSPGQLRCRLSDGLRRPAERGYRVAPLVGLGQRRQRGPQPWARLGRFLPASARSASLPQQTPAKPQFSRRRDTGPSRAPAARATNLIPPCCTRTALRPAARLLRCRAPEVCSLMCARRRHLDAHLCSPSPRDANGTLEPCLGGWAFGAPTRGDLSLRGDKLAVPRPHSNATCGDDFSRGTDTADDRPPSLLHQGCDTDCHGEPLVQEVAASADVRRRTWGRTGRAHSLSRHRMQRGRDLGRDRESVRTGG